MCKLFLHFLNTTLNFVLYDLRILYYALYIQKKFFLVMITTTMAPPLFQANMSLLQEA